MTSISVKRILGCFAIAFVLLFCFRLGYGFHTTPATPQKQSSRDTALRSSSLSDEFFSSKKNYASEKLASRPIGLQPSAPMPVDQKYEKTATLVSTTNDFEGDDARIRQKIEDYKGIIQHEQKSRRSGNSAATLRMLIGIQPSSFDEFCRDIQALGTLESLDIDKKDKTNEYLNLKARRASLESSRTALMELKKLEGRVDEFTNLQFRILELDQQLQALGVQLGDYDEVNEFCSVHLTLFEVREWWNTPPGTMHRLMVAFTWTVKYYALCLVLVAGALFCAFLLVGIISMLSRWKNDLSRAESNEKKRPN